MSVSDVRFNIYLLYDTHSFYPEILQD